MSSILFNFVYSVDAVPADHTFGPVYDGPLPYILLRNLVAWLTANPDADRLPPLPYVIVTDEESTLEISRENEKKLLAEHSRLGWAASKDCFPYLPLGIGAFPRRLLKCDDPVTVLFEGGESACGDVAYTFADFRSDVVQMHLANADVASAPVVRSPGTSAVRDSYSLDKQVSVVPRDDENDVDEIVSVNSVWLGATALLTRQLELHGFDKFINLLSVTMGLADIMKGVPKLSLDAKLISEFGVLLSSHKLTKGECLAFYKENCRAVLQLVRQNFFNDLRSETVLSCDEHLIITDKKRYDFSTLSVLVCPSNSVMPSLSKSLIENAGDAYIPSRLRSVGTIQVSLVQQWAMFAAFWTAAKRNDSNSKVFEFQLPILSDDRSKPKIVVQTNVVYLPDIPTLPTGFESAGKEMQCAYIVRAVASGDIKGVSPYVHVGATRFNPYMLYLDIVAVKEAEPFAPLMALERARKLRAHTVMDGATENAFMFHRLTRIAKPEKQDDGSILMPKFVAYSSEVARAMHICAYIVRNKLTHVLWVLQAGSSTLSVIDKIFQLRDKYHVDFRFTFGNAKVPTNLNVTLYKDVLVDVKTGMLYLESNKGTVVWLQNPSNNDYLCFSEPKDTVSVTQTNLLSKASRVIKLVCFARKEKYYYGVDSRSVFEILCTDVPLPYDTYYSYRQVVGEDGVPLNKHTYVEEPLCAQGGRFPRDSMLFVPLGHNAHSSQRVVSYEVGLSKSIQFGRPDEARYGKYGIWETVAMSQRRDRAIGEYYSEEIAALEFTGLLVDGAADSGQEFDDYE